MARTRNPNRPRVAPAVAAGLIALSVLSFTVASLINGTRLLVNAANWDDQWYSYVGMGAIVLFVLGWSLVATSFIWRLTNGKA